MKEKHEQFGLGGIERPTVRLRVEDSGVGGRRSSMDFFSFRVEVLASTGQHAWVHRHALPSHRLHLLHATDAVAHICPTTITTV
ncbi:hypothetical protein IG631_19422 [Alternaria alternata]|nr:hypothetical protein IG631_19422 [Alternaria alternata]